jgi:hypothetical protein
MQMNMPSEFFLSLQSLGMFYKLYIEVMGVLIELLSEKLIR